MNKRTKWNDDALQWTTDTGEFDLEGTIENRKIMDEGKTFAEFIAPGAEQKWRARNLVDIHWALTAIKTPSESYNRVLSCIIDHANPHSGLCYPSQSIIAIETGCSVETVKRAVKWWKKQGFLKTESRGLGRALAYHPQWDLLESFWVGVTSDIEEQKASRVTKGTYDVGHQGDLREGHQGDLREGHHADLQNLKP
jgi:Helix-turn-helix domain